jgi:hypothetical protein
MQHRKAWCRSCGGFRSYAVGWQLVTPDVERALQDRAGGRIQSHKAPTSGLVLVRLRLRHLACAHCNEVGLLVAGNPPRFQLAMKAN